MGNMLDLIVRHDSIMVQSIKREIDLCNRFSKRYGLSLSAESIENLMESRREILRKTERIELGESIMPKLIYAFCDSPFMEQDIYEETLDQLQEAFYYYKNESLDLYSDDEIIEFMVMVFNGRAQGSTEYLIGTSLDTLARYARVVFDANDMYEAGDLF